MDFHFFQLTSNSKFSLALLENFEHVRSPGLQVTGNFDFVCSRFFEYEVCLKSNETVHAA